MPHFRRGDHLHGEGFDPYQSNHAGETATSARFGIFDVSSGKAVQLSALSERFGGNSSQDRAWRSGA